MNFIEFVIDSETLEKNRRSLVAASILIFIIAALDFRSTEIDLLGLKLGISQGKIVCIGQLGASYLLLLYSSRWLGVLLSKFYEFLHEVDTRWEENTVAGFPDFSDEQDFQPDPDPWEVNFSIERSNREKRRYLLKIATNYYSKFIGIFSNAVFPIVLGATSIIKADALRLLLMYMGQ